MSKINDALKRAKNAQRQNNIPSGATPMRPIEPKKEERDFSWILPVIVILLIVVAVFFIALALAKRTANAIVATSEIPSTQQVETAVVSLPPPAPIGLAAISNTPPVTPRVQGIAFDPVHPWAIIGGKTVSIGDTVGGMRVVEITHDSVILMGNGQTNKLYVGQ